MGSRRSDDGDGSSDGDSDSDSDAPKAPRQQLQPRNLASQALMMGLPTDSDEEEDVPLRPALRKKRGGTKVTADQRKRQRQGTDEDTDVVAPAVGSSRRGRQRTGAGTDAVPAPVLAEQRRGRQRTHVGADAVAAPVLAEQRRGHAATGVASTGAFGSRLSRGRVGKG